MQSSYQLPSYIYPAQQSMTYSQPSRGQIPPRWRRPSMGCSDRIKKVLLIILNFVMAIFGIFLVYVAVMTLMSKTTLEEININPELAYAPEILIALGALIFVVAFFGCCGALCENPCMLTTYGAFLIILMICQIIFSILVLLKNTYKPDLFTSGLKDAFNKSPSDVSLKMSLKALQKSLVCCGVEGPNDFETNQSWPDELRKSCCASPPCQKLTRSANFTVGCAAKINQLLVTVGSVTAGVGVAVTIVQVLAIAGAFVLAQHIRNQD